MQSKKAYEEYIVDCQFTISFLSKYILHKSIIENVFKKWEIIPLKCDNKKDLY